MFANIWLTSALTITAIFSASAIYKSYSDLQEAKQIQESFQIITDMKTLIAKQYNKNPKDITRDELIAFLPNDIIKDEANSVLSVGNWEKFLLLDRNNDSSLSSDELVNEDGKIVINKEDKIKLLAIKAKLKDEIKTDTFQLIDNKYIFEVGDNSTNIVQKDVLMQKALQKAIYYMLHETIYGTQTQYDVVVQGSLEFTPVENIYQDLGSYITQDEQILLKKNYFKSRLKAMLENTKNSDEEELYLLIKDNL